MAMSQEQTNRQQDIINREQRRVQALTIALLATIIITVFIGVWVAKDYITTHTMFIIPYTVLSLYYMVYMAYSIFVALTMSVTDETPRISRLTYYHGFISLVALIAMAVGGLIVYFIKHVIQ